MPWNESGTFAVRLSVETLTANREQLWPDTDGTIAIGAGIGSGVAVFSLHRADTTAEGGELRFLRAVDDGNAWAIDCFGSGSVATTLRFIDMKAGSVPMYIDQSSQSVFNNKLAVSGTAIHSGYTQLGDASPVVKMKKLTGTLGGDGVTVNITHGVTASKIIAVSALASASNGAQVQPAFTRTAGFQYDVSISSNGTSIAANTNLGNSAEIQNRSIIITLFYEV